MKYQIYMETYGSRTVEFNADGPHDAIKAAIESNPGFRVVALWPLIDNPECPEEPLVGDTIEIAGGCESCGKPIVTGDVSYVWGGEDAVLTCIDCGGANETHIASVA